jgi:signal transduction histidine kinase
MDALVEGALAAVRRISADLRPPVLDQLGLAAAIEWHVGRFAEQTGLRCRLDVPDRAVDVDRERTTALFRILQEALTNVARHARAKAVTVRLAVGSGRAALEIEDDGRGLPARTRTTALGILGMGERARAFGGTLTVTGPRGRGTRVFASIPLGRSRRSRRPGPSPDAAR